MSIARRADVEALLHGTRGSSSFLARAAAEVGALPVLAPRDGRVEDSDSQTGDDDHGALEDHVWDLGVGDFAAEALGQLGDTVYGTNVDCGGGDGEGWKRC